MAKSPLRTFHFTEFSPSGLAERKADTTISVCLPAHNEAATVGRIVSLLRRELVEEIPLVDEIVVVDDHSTDDTAAVAAGAGAFVVDAATAVAGFDDGPGKGAAMWASLACSRGDVVVWCDADVTNFGSHYIAGLVGPLLIDPTLVFVKGLYQRPTDTPGGGGRVTELTARPVLALLFPELQAFHQPLSGEYAGRRSALEKVRFERDYGVEIGLLIDLWRANGLDALSQVDLGSRVHRNRPMHALSVQATQVLRAALVRAESSLVNDAARLERLAYEPVDLRFGSRPPLATHSPVTRANSSAGSASADSKP